MFKFLEDSHEISESYFYDDTAETDFPNASQKGAIRFLFQHRAQFVVEEALEGSVESDWMEHTVTYILSPLFNPDREFLKRYVPSIYHV